MEGLRVSTSVARPPEAVFDLLADFERYARYSDYLDSVTANGAGGPGTAYALTFRWWKVRYDVTSEVTAMSRPHEIAFRLTSGIAARGRWVLEPEPTETAGTDPVGLTESSDDGEMTTVSLLLAFDPDSVSDGAVSLPSLVSLPWVIERVQPLLEREARAVVERVVADLEGESRRVDLEVDHVTPETALPEERETVTDRDGGQDGDGP